MRMRSEPAGNSRRRPPRFAALALVAFAVGTAAISCRTSTEPDPNGGITIQLDSVPLLLKADSVSTATVWATVLSHGAPVPDSTVVQFAASLGIIETEARTKDGLARVNFRAGKETGIAAVVAQTKAVRDTVLVTLY